MKTKLLILILLSLASASDIPNRPDIRPFDESVYPVRITGHWHEPRLKFHKEYLHSGIDYSLPFDGIIRATGDGEITNSRDTGDYGNLLIINHGTWWDEERKEYVTVETYYGHCAEFKFLKGAKVKKGQPVALAGHTGYCDGIHVHYEVRINGRQVFPGFFNYQRNRELKK